MEDNKNLRCVIKDITDLSTRLAVALKDAYGDMPLNYEDTMFGEGKIAKDRLDILIHAYARVENALDVLNEIALIKSVDVPVLHYTDCFVNDDYNLAEAGQ